MSITHPDITTDRIRLLLDTCWWGLFFWALVLLLFREKNMMTCRHGLAHDGLKNCIWNLVWTSCASAYRLLGKLLELGFGRCSFWELVRFPAQPLSSGKRIFCPHTK